MFSKTLLPLLVLALSITEPVSGAVVRRSKCKPKSNIIHQAVDGSGMYEGITKLNGWVEGASVDVHGNIYAVDNQTFTSLYPSKTTKVVTAIDFSGNKDTHLAASRHTRTLGTLIGNANGKVIYTTKGDGKYENFIKSDEFLQPNDFTLDEDEKRLFFTGQKWDKVSFKEHGEVGCIDTKTKKITKVPRAVLDKANTYRINGIDLSPDDKYLYVTSERNIANPDPTGEPLCTEQKIYRFNVPKEGCDLGAPTEWVDLNKALAQHGIVDTKKKMDPDGLRTDDKGRVYVALNAFGMVMRITGPEFNEIIKTKTVANPSNLEFGHPEGNHVVIIGRCSGDSTSPLHSKACVDYLGINGVGRAYKNLNKGNKAGNGIEGKKD
ncbi:NHL repeat-containing protein [Ascobolus immersus RN42]|uniref:NHL repeat-containing protein n=1 Tax=Ascobolus immersus RN42 TaxID=1160509 RepID=A0A3N4IMD4_ASCIM|nr:NHL repeat-containing protein [Ascobolus immersus RN42]